MTDREQRFRHRIDALLDERAELRLDNEKKRLRIANLEKLLAEFDWVAKLERLEAKNVKLGRDNADLERALKAEQKRSENAQVASRLNRERADKLDRSLRRMREKTA